jgi:hypothetical protein
MRYSGIPKIYPNLNPAAAMPVDRDQIFRLHDFVGHYRMSRGHEHGHYVPNACFVFVTTMNGETLMHQRFRHPSLSSGKPVLYAGEAYFNNGDLQWWSNGSGNYRPDAAHAAQAGLPMDHFYPYDFVLKGLHTRPRTERATEFTKAHGAHASGAMQARMTGLGRQGMLPGWR